MVEVTESQGKDLVLSIKKIGEVEDCKVAAVGEMAAAQLAYFKVRDRDISTNQKGLIDAVYSLSNVLVTIKTVDGSTEEPEVARRFKLPTGLCLGISSFWMPSASQFQCT
jgi:hypothetical protein